MREYELLTPEKSDEDKTSQNFEGDFNELLESLKQEYDDSSSVLKSSKEVNSMASFLRHGISSMNDRKKYKNNEDNRLYVSNIARIPRESSKLALSDRVKLENMVE